MSFKSQIKAFRAASAFENNAALFQNLLKCATSRDGVIVRLVQWVGKRRRLFIFFLLDRHSRLILLHYLNKPGFKEGKTYKENEVCSCDEVRLGYSLACYSSTASNSWSCQLGPTHVHILLWRPQFYSPDQFVTSLINKKLLKSSLTLHTFEELLFSNLTVPTLKAGSNFWSFWSSSHCSISNESFYPRSRHGSQSSRSISPQVELKAQHQG